jgi:hypothetical protein
MCHKSEFRSPSLLNDPLLKLIQFPFHLDQIQRRRAQNLLENL